MDAGVDAADYTLSAPLWRIRLDELAGLFAEGAIDASQLRRGTADLRTQLAAVNSTLAELARTSPVANLLAAGDEVEKHWAALSPDTRARSSTS